MGGSLQPFFAQRNMEAEAAMSSNSYLAPAAEGRTDTELARSVAALEHQQQERQRRASQQQQVESDAEMACRVAYQQAQQPTWQQQQYQQHQQQPMPPLPGTHPAAHSMSGGGEPTTRQPMQTWNNGSGAHWDSEIARQMSGQHLVALQPRINSSAAMNVPPESSAQARSRLEQRLKLYGLCERKIKGDGACQFRSVSDQLYRTQDHHAEVRRVAVHQLRSNFYKYSEFVPSDYWKYVYDMEQSDTWGDHICLQAIADAYGLKINIITSYPQQDSCFIGITPDKVKTHRILYLSFWAEIHYNSIYPKSEPPASEKFWGSKKLARWLA